MYKLLVGTVLLATSPVVTAVAGQGHAAAQAPKQADSAPTAVCDQPNEPLVSFSALTLGRPGAVAGNCTSAVGSSPAGSSY
jgi:hypothetical protein